MPAPNNEKIRQNTFRQDEGVPPCKGHGEQVGIVHADHDIYRVAIPCGPLSALTTWEENIFKIRRDIFHRTASTYNRNFKKLTEFNSTEALDGQLVDLPA